ncbi:MAG: hypothetical protein HY342_11305 [Candidatus Lambdaproteobacteria bacterium]|nr:hypothetical protein [Candidatus Lambdaproteobacteria bacterium]
MVLLRDRDAGGGPPEVLMLQRHAEDKFAAGAYVFPGGMLESIDYGPRALALSPLGAREAGEALPDVSPAEKALGFFIAAIRETFEEAGILLARTPEGTRWHPTPRELPAVREARRALHAGRLDFVDWVRGMGLRLATDEFQYFAHWITPAVRPIRFDARFFAVEVGPDVTAEADLREVQAPIWVTPGEALERFQRKEVNLLGATRANLSLLARYPSTREALAALRERTVEAILPKLRNNPDGSVTPVFPWDAQYQTL